MTIGALLMAGCSGASESTGDGSSAQSASNGPADETPKADLLFTGDAEGFTYYASGGITGGGDGFAYVFDADAKTLTAKSSAVLEDAELERVRTALAAVLAPVTTDRSCNDAMTYQLDIEARDGTHTKAQYRDCETDATSLESLHDLRGVLIELAKTHGLR